ncbi:TetR/AcrR family transcriptional regulator [Pseudomaricurvus sp. HS19]|uniref:TetR/AcrR family transcriptional regulator n=1 Tax=Pseudomaricurvus sp. HS19 TaxID=2692626 RepID=UPI00136EF59D|nr:TetR/AcrR family transcriptional regulator [Pseudomaricurvus sp. HS19]MYM64048.1 TetR family transcriptional regulator [Pseudomaricurvus sp. HS19]
MADSTPQLTRPRKRRRDPERTREAILEVSAKLMAKDGPEALSVSQVAQLAGVNRGTAYHHFQTREQLVKATTDWVSEKMTDAVFGDAEQQRNRPEVVLGNLAHFCVEYPEFGRVWLVRILSMEDRNQDHFWRQFKSQVDRFVASEAAHEGIDAEVHAVRVLTSAILWPVWMRSRSATPEEREEMASRFTREMMRLHLDGLFRKEKYSDLEMMPTHL